MALTALFATLVLAALAASASAAAPAAPPPSRLEGTFKVKAKITSTKNFPDEKKGDKFSRKWTFTPTCATGPCATVKLKRKTPNKVFKSTLKWNGSAYTSKDKLTLAAICSGKTVKNTDAAVIKIKVNVDQTVVRKGVPVSTKITEQFRSNHKITCPHVSGTAHSSSTGTGKRTDTPPEPVAPTASFDSSEVGSIGDGTNTLDFADTSEDPDGGEITAWHWTFGDGGTDNTSAPSHTYAAAGTYTVTLTVTDSDDGLTSSTHRDVRIDP